MPNWKKVITSGSSAELQSLNVTAAVTASSFSGSFVGDGSGLTGLSAAAITSTANGANNRIATYTDSDSLNGEANLTFDGANLNLTGNLTASGAISASGDIIGGNDLTIIKQDGTPAVFTLNSPNDGFGRPFTITNNGAQPTINAQDILRLHADDGDAEIKLDPSGQDKITFSTNGTERYKIDHLGNHFFSSSISASGNVIIKGHITASGNISGSGTGSLEYLMLGGATSLTETTTRLEVTGQINAGGNGNSGVVRAYQGKFNQINNRGTGFNIMTFDSGNGVCFKNHITASGNISASGTSHTFGGSTIFGDSPTSDNHQFTGSLNVTGSATIFGNTQDVLTVKSSLANHGFLKIHHTSHVARLRLTSNASTFEVIGDAVGGSISGGGYIFNTPTDRDTYHFSINNTPKMTLEAGRLGIGEGYLHSNVPSEMLDVSGSAIIRGNITASGNISASGNLIGVTGSLKHIVVNNGSGIGKIQDGGGELHLVSDDLQFIGDSVKFISQGTEVINIDSTSNPIDFTSTKNIGFSKGISSTNITASGNISASGGITSNTINTSGNITSGDRLIAAGRIIGSSTLSATEGIFSSHITSSGNISGSGNLIIKNITSSGNIAVQGNYSGSINTNYFGDEFNAHGADANSGFTILALGSKPQLLASSGRLQIGNSIDGSHTIFSNAITASAAILGTSATLTGNLVVGGKVTAQEFHTEFVSSSIVFQSGSTKFGDDTSDSHNMTGSLNVSGSINLTDNARVILGSGNDFNIYHDGSTSRIQNTTGDVRFINFQDDGDIIFQSDNGSGGVTAYLTLDGGNVRTLFSKEARFSDDVSLKIGSGGDLGIYHSSNNSYIENITGDLFIQTSTTSGDIKFRSGSTEFFRIDGGSVKSFFSKPVLFNDGISAQFGSDTDLSIYHDGSEGTVQNATGHIRFLQTAAGQDIIFRSGSTEFLRFDGGAGQTIFTQDLKLLDDTILRIGSGGDFRITHTGVYTDISNLTGDLKFNQNANDANIVFNSDDGSGGVTEYFRIDGGSVTNIFSKPVSITGSLTASGNISASGQFIGDGSGLTGIPAEGIVGLNLSQIASGSATASIAPDKGFVINTNITASGNISASGTGFFEGGIRIGGTSGTTTEIVDSFGEKILFGTNDLTVCSKHINAEFGVFARSAATGRQMGIDGSSTCMGLYTAGHERVSISQVGDMVVTGSIAGTNITASGNISGSGTGSFADGRFTGKVGIGTSSPSADLHILTNGGSNPNIFVSGSNSGHIFDAVINNDQRFRITNAGDINFSVGSDSAKVHNTSAGGISLSSRSTEADLFISSSGNVGIGTTSPSEKLIVTGSGRVTRIESSNDSVPLVVENSGGDRARIGFRANNSTSDYHVSAGAIGTSFNFTTNDTERARITNDGNLGIGTTNPTALLHVSSSTSLKAIIEGNNGNSLLRLKRTDQGKYFDLSLEGNDLRFNPGTLDNSQNVLFGVNGGSQKVASRVGIGQPNPESELDVSGSIRVSGPGHITASGNISASGDITLDNVLKFGGSSSTISTALSSGDITIKPDGDLNLGTIGTDRTCIGRTDNAAYQTRFFGGATDEVARVSSGSFKVFAPITASGNISASGNTHILGGKLGIGVVDPDNTLEVRGAATAAGTTMSIDNSYGESPKVLEFTYNGSQAATKLIGYGRPNSNPNALPYFAVEVNNSLSGSSSITTTERMRIISSGNVGIGTTSPSTLLELSGSGGSSSGLSFTNGSGEIFRQYFQDENADSNFLITYDGTGGAEITLKHDGDVILNGTNGDNVGIGTSTPNGKLGVSGSINVLGPNGHITASGNISASGDITGDNVITDFLKSKSYPNNNYLDLDDDTVTNANGVGLFAVSSMVFGIDSNNNATNDNFKWRADGANGGAGTELMMLTDDGDLTVTGNVSGSDLNIRHITASNNISASGTGSFSGMNLKNLANRTSYVVTSNNHTAKFEAFGSATAIDTTATNGIFLRTGGAGQNRVHIHPSYGACFDGHITASGNISASGTIIGPSGSFSHGLFKKNVQVTGSLLIGGNGKIGLNTTAPGEMITVRGCCNFIAAEHPSYEWGGTNPLGIRMGVAQGAGTDCTATGGVIDFFRWKGSSTNFTVARIGQNVQHSGNLYGLNFMVDNVSTCVSASTSRLYISPTGNVGIGNTNPNEKFSVSGNISASGNVILVGDVTSSGLRLNSLSNAGSDTDKFLTLDASGNVVFRTGAEVLSDIGASSTTGTVDTTGSPVDNQIAIFSDADTIGGSTKLTFDETNLIVTGNLSASGNLILGGDITAGTINATKIVSNVVSQSISFASGSNIFGDANSDTHSFTGSLKTSGSITQFGNTYNLLISDGSIVRGSNHLQVEAQNSYLNVMSPNNAIYYRADANHIFRNGNGSSTYMTLDTSGTGEGNLGIGNTSPTEMLTVGGNISSSGNIILQGHITASGNVSASGTIIGNLVPQVPKVEYYTVTSSTLVANTLMDLPNSLTYITSSGGYEYLEIFADGMRLSRDVNYTEIDTNTVRYLTPIPSQSLITYKSIRLI